MFSQGGLSTSRSGYKQVKLSQEFFSGRTAYIATHIQEVSGLRERIKINTSQLQNELLTQVTLPEIAETVFICEPNGCEM